MDERNSVMYVFMLEMSRRIEREKNTVKAMVTIYCERAHRTTGQLCPECDELLSYAFARLDKCPFTTKKPTCQKCNVHCYEASMRSRVTQVMRYSGPRMIRKHPILAVQHLIVLWREKHFRQPRRGGQDIP